MLKPAAGRRRPPGRTSCSSWARTGAASTRSPSGTSGRRSRTPRSSPTCATSTTSWIGWSRTSTIRSASCTSSATPTRTARSRSGSTPPTPTAISRSASCAPRSTPPPARPRCRRLGGRVDGLTRIHIKGCDIGRTQGMVELIDEAFGGAGVVTAPTHEQVYGWDPTLAEQGRRRFRAEVAATHPMPPEVDPALRGAERRQAVRERARALRDRQRAIQAELRTRRAEETAAGEQAGRYEALSGPMFQRPGTQLIHRRGDPSRGRPPVPAPVREAATVACGTPRRGRLAPDGARTQPGHVPPDRPARLQVPAVLDDVL